MSNKLSPALNQNDREIKYFFPCFIPWIFTVLRKERKMVRRFVKVSEEEIEEAFFIHLIWYILKQLSLLGSVKSGRYIPRRFPSRYISNNIHPPFGG